MFTPWLVNYVAATRISSSLMASMCRGWAGYLEGISIADKGSVEPWLSDLGAAKRIRNHAGHVGNCAAAVYAYTGVNLERIPPANEPVARPRRKTANLRD